MFMQLIVLTVCLAACGTKNAEELRRLGVDAHNDSNFAEAAVYLEDALKLDPKDEVAHKYLALTNERLQQFPQAKNRFLWLTKNAESKADRDAAAASAARLGHTDARTAKPRVILLTTESSPYTDFNPVFEKVCGENKDKLDFEIIDIEKTDRHVLIDSYKQYLADKYSGDWSVPMMMFECRHGVLKDSSPGHPSEEEMRAQLSRLLADESKEADPG